jgi:hypothetical protein
MLASNSRAPFTPDKSSGIAAILEIFREITSCNSEIIAQKWPILASFGLAGH